MTKKILLIIGILVLLGLAALFIFKEPAIDGGDSSVGFSFRNYFPFGQEESTINISPSTRDGQNNNQNENTQTNNVGNNQNQPIPRLRKISSEPVAGGVVWNIGTTTFVRFVEKGTGNVYEARGDSLKIIRLTNTTIPKIIRAFWLPNASGFLAQTLVPESEIIETSFVSLIKASASTTETLTPFTTRISKLRTGIKEVVVSPDSKKIFFYTVDAGANFYTASPDGTGQTIVLSHPLAEWLPRYWVGNNVLLQTKEGGTAPAYFYLLNLSNKSPVRTSNPMTTIRGSVATWTEKCALPINKDSFAYCAVPNQIIPLESWYKGQAFTTDSIRKIDTKNDVFYNTADLSHESGEKVDVVDLAVSADETHLIFRNKIDGYLWLLRVEE